MDPILEKQGGEGAKLLATPVMRVLIVGCGYVGLAVGADLARRGHQVWGLRRTGRADAKLNAAGIIPLRADITQPETLAKLEPEFDWVVHCVSASGGGEQEYQQVYFRGTGHLLDWLTGGPPVRIVYTGSTSVYAKTDGSTVDETSLTQPQAPTGRILLDTESLLLQPSQGCNVSSTVLRVGAIYGPGRAYWLEQFLAGTAKLDGTGSRVLNMIHRDDVAGAILAALLRGKPGHIYNAVDDEPVSQFAFFSWLASRLGQAMPAPAGERREQAASPPKRGLTSKRVSNRRLKTELNYQFKFPSFRLGYESILADLGR